MRSRGFTLIELMIVVVIVGVLAVVASSSYKKYSNKGRTAEVMAMFGEFRVKEEAFRAEFSRYCGSAATALASCDTPQASETTFWPALLSTGEPMPKVVSNLAARPAAWRLLGINPGKNQLYCGYAAVAGPAGQSPVGADGLALVGATPASSWFTLHATCDNDGKAATNVVFFTSSTSTSIVTRNENR